LVTWVLDGRVLPGFLLPREIVSAAPFAPGRISQSQRLQSQYCHILTTPLLRCITWRNVSRCVGQAGRGSVPPARLSNVSSQALPREQGQPEPERGRVATWVGVALVTLALTSALATFLVISGSTRIVPVHRVVISLFIVNALIILALLLLVTWQAFTLFRARSRGAAAAGLHIRIILLFGLIAALPAILVAVIATITLEKGLEP
jgi:hypothetical protein